MLYYWKGSFFVTGRENSEAASDCWFSERMDEVVQYIPTTPCDSLLLLHNDGIIMCTGSSTGR